MSEQARSIWADGREFSGLSAAIVAMLREVFRLRGPERMPRTLMLHPDGASCFPSREDGTNAGMLHCVYGDFVLRYDERSARGSATLLAADGRPAAYLAPDSSA